MSHFEQISNSEHDPGVTIPNCDVLGGVAAETKLQWYGCRLHQALACRPGNMGRSRSFCGVKPLESPAEHVLFCWEIRWTKARGTNDSSTNSRFLGSLGCSEYALNWSDHVKLTMSFEIRTHISPEEITFQQHLLKPIFRPKKHDHLRSGRIKSFQLAHFYHKM